MKDKQYIVADNVRLYRKKERMTQIELAERADLSLDSIKRIESGKRTISLENFLKISEALYVPASFLLNDEEDTLAESEWVRNIFEGRSDKQKRYLLHMLWEMAKKMDELF